MTQPAQLALLDTQPVAWRLDERTRRIGREGLAQARAALAAGLRDDADPPETTAAPAATPARTAPPTRLVRRQRSAA